ncbi:hypothetical protein IFM89_005581 [Coptis chinensis]|uniref:PsbP C-terminal domain-containing protein n=1 Tax=Coptis chinensis TaxID=261450 RepID=A0A835M1N7_9MAGN|nr:hypothetical protein IFM89_005581 [Coptis chinensis]
MIYSVCMKQNEEEMKIGKTKRREALLQTVFAAFSLPSIASTALAETDVQESTFGVYSDETKKFKIVIPKDWIVGEGESDGIRSLTAFYPEESTSSNVSVLISGLGADYTKLESFGKVDEFAETLVELLLQFFEDESEKYKIVKARS